MCVKERLKLKKNKDLEEITEIEFEKGLIDIVKILNSEIKEVYSLIDSVNYYKNREYRIIYYKDNKNRTYNFKAVKKQIGFKYEVEK